MPAVNVLPLQEIKKKQNVLTVAKSGESKYLTIRLDFSPNDQSEIDENGVGKEEDSVY